MHIERLSSEYFYRTCDVHILFQMDRYAETCRSLHCVYGVITQVILNKTCSVCVVYPAR
jgi:hypothetical protein